MAIFDFSDLVPDWMKSADQRNARRESRVGLVPQVTKHDDLLREPMATDQLNSALTEIINGTEYVQGYLRIRDQQIADMVAHRALVAGEHEKALKHILEQLAPELMDATSFRNEVIDAARAAPPTPTHGASVHNRPTIVLPSQDKAREVATSMANKQ